MSICPSFVRRGAIALVAALLLVPVFGQRAHGQALPKPTDTTSVRERIRASGLTPEQIREQLRIRGLSPTALDAYFGPATAGTATGAPSADVLAAVAVLGELDKAALAAATLPGRPVAASSAPTTFEGLEVFGLKIFRGATNQFEPNLAGPVDENYRLGALDMVAIIVTGQVELSYTLEVTRDGFIVIPQVGQVFVANMPLAEATQVIVQKMRQSYSGAGSAPTSPTKVFVTVARLRTNQVFVVGDVVTPGSMQVSAAGTAMSALYAAGGPTTSGTMRTIEVRRGDKVVSTLDVYDYLLHGDASKDVRLESGDRVFVPPNPRYVAIAGEVVRPQMYELKSDETLADLIVIAGGYTPNAATRRILISRVLPPAERALGGRDRVMIDVGGAELARGSAPRTPLLPGDRVSVFAITSPVRDVVSIGGNVWAPGDLGFKQGMHLSDAIKASGGLKEDTYLQELQVSRLLPDLRREQIRARFTDTSGTVSPDIELRDADIIRVFAASEFRTDRAVSIAGKVRRPVVTAYLRGMTFRDLMTLAGGVEDGTDALDTVSVSRLQLDLTRRAFTMPLRDASGAFAAFPLEQGDAFQVFARSEFRPKRYVAVGGAVNAAKEIPFSEGITLRQAILAAGGLQESALLGEVEISRMPADRSKGQMARVFRVPIDSSYVFERGPDGKYLGPPGLPAKAGVAPEVVLQPYDQINVFGQPEWSVGGSVDVSGEVQFPGSFAIRERGERISDIVARAGGLTSRAYPAGTVFIRRIDPRTASERDRALGAVQRDHDYAMAMERLRASGQATSSLPVGSTAGISPVISAADAADRLALAAVLQGDASGVEHVAIDLAAIMKNPKHRDNLTLRPGDQLIVSREGGTVAVRGFVGEPVSLPYVAGANFWHYVHQSGGATRNADVGRAFVVQPSGRIDAYRVRRFWPDAMPTPLPGSTIVVPPRAVEIKVPNTTWPVFVTGIATLVTSLVLLIRVTR